MSRLKILLLNLPWPARGNLRHELRGPGWVGFPLIGRYIKNIRKILIQHQVEVKNNTKKHKTFSEWTFWNLSPPPLFFFTQCKINLSIWNMLKIGFSQNFTLMGRLRSGIMWMCECGGQMQLGHEDQTHLTQTLGVRSLPNLACNHILSRGK